MSKLSQSVVTRTKPAKSDVFVWDSKLPGFGLRVKPSGVRSFIIQYRNAGGRSRRYTIGRHGVLTPEEARTEAKQLLGQIAKGADPASGRSSARKAPTMGELADRYLREHAEPHKKPSSVAEDRRLIEARVKPKLGAMKVGDVARADIAKLHHALRATPYEANRTLALLSKMFSLAELWGLRADGTNPCRHVKRYRESKRERFLSADELGRIGKALTEAERSRSESEGVIAAIRLLALTGCRLSEILVLRWDHVDLEKSALRLPDAKAGARIVPLGAAARALLAKLPKHGIYVAAGDDLDGPLSVWVVEKAWGRLRTAAKLADVRLHDFRHTVGTYGGQAGFNAFVVRDLLGHKTLAMTGRYVERDIHPLRTAADAVSGRIAAAMQGNVANVAKLERRKRSR